MKRLHLVLMLHQGLLLLLYLELQHLVLLLQNDILLLSSFIASSQTGVLLQQKPPDGKP